MLEEAIIGGAGAQTTWIVDSKIRKGKKKKKNNDNKKKNIVELKNAAVPEGDDLFFLSLVSLGLLLSLSSRGKNIREKGGWFDGHSFRILCIIHFSRFMARRLFGKGPIFLHTGSL